MQIKYTNFNKDKNIEHGFDVESSPKKNKLCGETPRTAQTYVYVGFVNTPGLFASIIRRVIAQKYIHVVLGLDENLDEAYSVGRRNPAIPLIAGFEKEEKERILKVFPTAEYMVCRIPCTSEQKEYIASNLHLCMEERQKYHYTVLGLPFILMNQPFYQENHYTCSSYLARILDNAGVVKFDKHFSLVTPRDFMEYPNKEVVFEGALRELVETEAAYAGAQYAGI